MLDARILAQEFYDALESADRSLAGNLGLNFDKDVNTQQKQVERITMATAFANVLFKALTHYTVVVIPAHQPNSAITGVASGPGAHAHSSNQPPITHKNGKLI
jgi:hypothetical protein